MISKKYLIGLAAFLLLGQGCGVSKINGSDVSGGNLPAVKSLDANRPVFRGPTAPPKLKGPTEAPPKPAGQFPPR